MTETQTAMPVLPCPDCGENLLEKGFYNYCRETTLLREDNPMRRGIERLIVDHEESDAEILRHACALQAFCKECEMPLPWSLPELRALHGKKFADADTMIAQLIAKASETKADAKEPHAASQN